MDEYTKWKKAELKGSCHLYDILGKAKLQGKKTSVVVSNWEWKEGVDCKRNFWGDRNILYLDCIVVMWLFTLVKNHRTVHSKRWILQYENYTSIFSKWGWDSNSSSPFFAFLVTAQHPVLKALFSWGEMSWFSHSEQCFASGTRGQPTKNGP